MKFAGGIPPPLGGSAGPSYPPPGGYPSANGVPKDWHDICYKILARYLLVTSWHAICYIQLSFEIF